MKIMSIGTFRSCRYEMAGHLSGWQLYLLFKDRSLSRCKVLSLKDTGLPPIWFLFLCLFRFFVLTLYLLGIFCFWLYVIHFPLSFSFSLRMYMSVPPSLLLFLFFSPNLYLTFSFYPSFSFWSFLCCVHFYYLRLVRLFFLQKNKFLFIC